MVKSASHEEVTDKSSEELHTLRSQDAKALDNDHHPIYEVPGWQVVDPQELPGRPIRLSNRRVMQSVFNSRHVHNAINELNAS